MDRRQALRAAATVGIGLSAAGCSHHGTAPAAPGTTGPASASELPHTSSPRPSSPRASPPLVEVVHGPRTRSAVALTFHGQGDPGLADKLLSVLEARHAHVTVLAVGTWLETYPFMAQRILSGGHELGNHTQHHLAIAGMSAGQAFAEIDACAGTLRRLTGSIGTWFRPSQTQHSTPIIRAEAARAGYRTCLSYDVDSLDYTDPPAITVVNTTLGAVRYGSIVSMHLGHPVTTQAIGPVLDGLDARRLRAVTVTELMAA
jgi:peptidoglycan/xylan/chitin deacetylase (PgdA/CDA1 family)